MYAQILSESKLVMEVFVQFVTSLKERTCLGEKSGGIAPIESVIALTQTVLNVLLLICEMLVQKDIFGGRCHDDDD